MNINKANRAFIIKCLMLFSFVTGSMFVITADAAEPGIEVTKLLTTTHAWDGSEYKAYPTSQPEVTVLRYKIPAHSILPWHSHPVINVAYVVSGHLKVVRKSDEKSIIVGPGDVLPETVNLPHRGETQDEPVELIVFYAGTSGVPLVIKNE